MKKLICLLALVVVMSGCAALDRARQGFADGLINASKYQTPQPQYQKRQNNLQPRSTDLTCVNNCIAKGYMLPYCNSKCSYNVGVIDTTKVTDLTCVNDCVAKGNLLIYCNQECSY